MDKLPCSKGFRRIFNDGCASFNLWYCNCQCVRAKGIVDDKGLAKYMSIAGIEQVFIIYYLCHPWVCWFN